MSRRIARRLLKLFGLKLVLFYLLSVLVPDFSPIAIFRRIFEGRQESVEPRHSSIKSIAKESEEKSKIALDLLPNEVVVQKSDDRTDYAPYLTPGIKGNYEPLRDFDEVGNGENGTAFHVSKKKEEKVAEMVQIYGMNMAASDEISLDRSIPDVRMHECQYWNYPANLPKTSVVIVFHNEGLSVLQRTIHSVMNRSPEAILQEVLLVDDFSSLDNLKDELEIYIKRFRGKVRIIRNPKREGLIRSRNRGARDAKGVVVVFLDAHCEVNKNWLPPLLAPIYKDHTTMSVPIIDGIDHDTFEYKPVYSSGSHPRGIFEWGMLYKESEVPESVLNSRRHPSEPYSSPTHAGGLFAINRHYFLTLGLYDEGLLVWGGENFELSFKIWQCGGSIVWVPCSRVGHVYRSFMPYDFGDLVTDHKGSLITTNYKRVVEVWFDEKQKKYFYAREPTAKYIDIGDISKQLELKKKLNCKSFQWFLDNVAIEMKKEFPAQPPLLQWGKLINLEAKCCLDNLGKSAPSYLGCTFCEGDGSDGQLFRLNAQGQLGIGERCVTAEGTARAQQTVCQDGTVDGSWDYTPSTQQLRDLKSGNCLTFGTQRKVVFMSPCSSKISEQRWFFQKVIPSWAKTENRDL